LRALGVDGETTATAVACPDGGAAATYTVERRWTPADLGRSLQPALGGCDGGARRSDGWAYRSGSDSVVLRDGSTLHVSATTPCR
jgi:hypothetical protein